MSDMNTLLLQIHNTRSTQILRIRTLVSRQMISMAPGTILAILLIRKLEKIFNKLERVTSACQSF